MEAAFSTPQGKSGQGQAVSLTFDTGYFWFFSANNVEIVVKVVDGRAVNGKYCGAACSEPFDDRSAVTLSAVAAAGSTFAGWSGDCSGSGTFTLAMTGDHLVTATFTIR